MATRTAYAIRTQMHTSARDSRLPDATRIAQSCGPGIKIREHGLNHTHVHQTEEGLRNPHCVTRISAPPNLAPARKPPTPEATKPLRTPGYRDRTPA
jgi:hypothetical protein